MESALDIEISEKERLRVWNPRDIDGDFIKIGAISGHLGRQSQYLSHYLVGIAGVPDLSSGLRVKNTNPTGYHTFEIHRDDIKTFIERIRKYESRSV
jgi:hypothetical protein